MQSNIQQRVVFASPRSEQERGEIAGACVRKLHLTIPALLDPFSNATEAAYTAWPDRLYVIGREGRVVFKSKPGPFGFHPADMESALKTAL